MTHARRDSTRRVCTIVARKAPTLASWGWAPLVAEAARMAGASYGVRSGHRGSSVGMTRVVATRRDRHRERYVEPLLVLPGNLKRLDHRRLLL